MVWRTAAINPLEDGVPELQEVTTILRDKRFFLTTTPKTYIVTNLSLSWWNVVRQVSGSGILKYGDWEIAEKYSEYYATVKINKLF